MTDKATDLIEQLRPDRHARVIDLVDEAGLDTSDWANFSRGPGWAGANPKYCYEWCFTDGAGGTVLCLWHEELEPSDDTVVHRSNFRPDVYVAKDGKPQWKLRAQRLDDAVRAAFERGSPVRVILNAGRRRHKGDATGLASQVNVRLLDPHPWWVARYNMAMGDHELRRGHSGRSIDQFADEIEERRRERASRTSFVYNRDPKVRSFVLARAGGRCEYCGELGFCVPGGARYLETHHIEALCEDGRDHPNNVIALCPNHHREAHYGENSRSITAALLKIAATTSATDHSAGR